MTMVCDVCGRPERTPQRDGYGESDEVLSLASLSVPMTWSLSCKKGVMARCGCGETDGVKLHPADLNLYSFQGLTEFSFKFLDGGHPRPRRGHCVRRRGINKLNLDDMTGKGKQCRLPSAQNLLGFNGSNLIHTVTLFLPRSG
jgi:hypothetical protein